MAWSPLGGGALYQQQDHLMNLHMLLKELSEKYDNAGYDKLALFWLYQYPAHILPILGTYNLQRIENAAAEAEKIKLTREGGFAS